MPSKLLDLPKSDLEEFYRLHNAFKAADGDDRAKTSWKFLCFVYKHLGDEMLTYFIDKMFDDDGDARRTIAPMIRMRAFLQPHLN